MPAKKTENVFLRMYPLHRVLVSLCLSLIVLLFIRKYHFNSMMIFMILWDVFALSSIIFSWIVFFTSSIAHITKRAQKEDGSRVFVFNIVVVASFTSIFMVLKLIASNEPTDISKTIYLAIVIAGVILSWIMVHTTFCFHYAHLYYKPYEGVEKPATGLNFPSEQHPDFLDFAYFSFVIGMTFQVSDVQINSRVIRRLALTHALISFILNTFVVALTISSIAGLKPQVSL